MPTAAGDRVDRRTLNRALLGRQLLLERTAMAPLDAVEHLVGVQAQVPEVPYLALAARLAPFDPDDLGAHVAADRAVRAALMRGTIHLVSARDCRAWAPLVAPLLATILGSTSWGKNLRAHDVDAIVAAGEALLAERPRTRAELGRALAERWPDADPASLAWAVTYRLPLVQVPPRGVWGRALQATWARAEDRVGPLDEPTDAALDDLVLRYLAAFGPATPADLRTWARFSGLPAVVDRLRPRLRRLVDEDGRELLDVPDGVLPDPDTPAPVRILGEYDNALLGHADRRRIVPDRPHPDYPPGRGGLHGDYLVDGMLHGTWRIQADRASAVLDLQPGAAIAAADRDALEAEGARLLALTDPGRAHDVRVLPAPN